MKSLLYISSIGSILFSLTCFYPALSLTLFGFIFSLLCSILLFVSFKRFLLDPKQKTLTVAKKFLEYIPFVLFASFIISRSSSFDFPFFLDVISVALWIITSISATITLYKLSEKRIQKVFPEFSKQEIKKRSFFVHVLEWIDALIQAACMVLLINLFLFQLYAIPSESMVPEFMIGDRVIVFKTPSGPKFPLSRVGIGRFKTYSRGDIVVFTNPHYNDTKKDRIRSFASQLVYMLTFTSVNINKDEFGAIKADPLVKRIVGMPGEKLMMVDGILYAKQKGAKQFEPVQEEFSWANWNLDALPQSQKKLVARIPMSQEAYTQLESIESLRANVNIDELAEEAKELVEKFNNIRKFQDTIIFVDDLIPKNKREIYTLFQSNDEVTRILLTTNGGGIWFKKFMTDWIDNIQRDNLFEDRSFKLNILIKLDFGRLIVRNAELFTSNTSIDSFVNDTKRKSLLLDAEQFRTYLVMHDQRNMGVFPSKENEFLPENSFLLMGDNRFNSLDMRHSYSMNLAPIDTQDPWSILYRSNLSPQFVHADKILGISIYRFWPLSRLGKPE